MEVGSHFLADPMIDFSPCVRGERPPMPVWKRWVSARTPFLDWVRYEAHNFAIWWYKLRFCLGSSTPAANLLKVVAAGSFLPEKLGATVEAKVFRISRREKPLTLAAHGYLRGANARTKDDFL